MFIYHFPDNLLTMQNLDCVFLKFVSSKDGDNPLSTILVDVNKTHFIVNLWSPWNDIADYLPAFTPLKIFNVDKITEDDSTYFSAGKQSIVVVDPDVLLNATSVNSVSYCPRSYYLNEIIGETPSPYIAIRGSIVHDSLGLAVATKSKPSDVLPQVLDSFSLQYEYHGFNKESVYQDVRKMTESLDSFVSTLGSDALPEMLFLSPYFGIRGRIDLFDENTIYELKTAKVSEEKEIRFSDLLQVSLYNYGIQSKIDNTNQQDGTVIYVGTNEVILKTASPSWGLLRFGIEKRNMAYRISYLGYVPPILPESQIKKCEKCSVKYFCFALCAGLYQERRCSTCPHETLCSKKALPNEHQEYFRKFSNWIYYEKSESSQNLADLWKLSVDQRVSKGKAIKNLKLENEISEGIKTRLLFSCENNSEMREGDIVILSDGQLVQGFVSTGVISNISETSVEVETRSTQGSVSVIDLYSIDVGFRRQQRGLYNIIFRKNNFRELVVKGEKSIIKPVEGRYIPTNSVQNEAVGKILGTENYCLIQGPAGTGKTYIIAKAAIELAKQGDKVLLTAFTNRAVDNMCKYLLDNQFKQFIRLGSPHAIQPELKDYTLPEYQKQTPEKSAKEIITGFSIIVATTSTISNPVYERLGVRTIIVDEASQMTEPTILSALLEGSRFILVGDHKQLPPVVQSLKAQKEGMAVSLFERLAGNFPDSIHLLTHQFRMNEKLMEFSNQVFYKNKLKSFDDLVRLQNLTELASFTGDYVNFKHSEIYDPKTPLVYIPISGIFNPENKINLAEAKTASEVIKKFMELGLKSDQIGVICPYRGQVGELRRSLPPKAVVDTVDRFQGSDREFILLSLTENISEGSRGFSDPRRLNVAITRAKKKLVVIGDPQIDKKILGDYIDYLQTSAEVISQEKVETKPRSKEITIVAENISKMAKVMKKVLVAGKKITESEKDSLKCMVCFQPVYENAIECPVCEHLFHFDHLVAWIKDYERCPYCKTVLRLFD